MAVNFHLVQSLIKSLALFEALCESTEGMGVTEISDQVGLNKSTVHRILTTLVHEGYVDQDQAKGRYRLSPKLFELSRKILNNLRPTKVISKELEKLAQASGESARYAIIDPINSRLIISDEVLGNKPIKVRSHLGESLSLSQSAAGKMYLAGLSDSVIKEMMDRKGRRAVLEDEKYSFTSLQRDLKGVREKGFSYEKAADEDEMVCSVAAPVRNEQGDIIAIVDVIAPAYRCPKDVVDHFSDLVFESATQISKKLGFIPG